MKKLLIVISFILLFTGCTLDDIDNTPTKQVEAFFNNYQTLDKKVLEDLDLVLAKQKDFTTTQKEEYRNILKKHYQNLTYEIKDETVNGDRANVEVEIEVTDFYKVLKETESKKNEYINEDGTYNNKNYIDYQLDKLKNAKETVKYTLNLTLSKNDNGDWVLDNINENDESKILGIYEY